MSQPADLNSRIIEQMYGEALVLSDEVRAAFALSGRIEGTGEDSEDLRRIAISSEGLRTTTRVMHAIAWLLNHRAFFSGELSEFQLRRSGRLSPGLLGSDAQNLELLRPQVRDLVEATDRFYARLLRLDASWRRRDVGQMSAVASVRQRVGQRPHA